MKTKIRLVRFTLLLISMQFASTQMVSQSQFEIALIYSPSFSKLSSDFFEPRSFHSLGIELQKSLKSSFHIGSGVYFRMFGARFELPPDILHPRSYKASYITSSIAIPIKIGYYFISKNSFRAGINVGIENSFLLNQKGKRPERESEIGIYKSYFLGFAPSLSFGFKLNPKMFLNVEPYSILQLNKNNSPFKQLILGLNIGVSYNLSTY